MQCESYLSQGRGCAEKWQIRSVICNNREETWTNTVHISYMFFSSVVYAENKTFKYFTLDVAVLAPLACNSFDV